MALSPDEQSFTKLYYLSYASNMLTNIDKELRYLNDHKTASQPALSYLIVTRALYYKFFQAVKIIRGSFTTHEHPSICLKRFSHLARPPAKQIENDLKKAGPAEEELKQKASPKRVREMQLELKNEAVVGKQKIIPTASDTLSTSSPHPVFVLDAFSLDQHLSELANSLPNYQRNLKKPKASFKPKSSPLAKKNNSFPPAHNQNVFSIQNMTTVAFAAIICVKEIFSLFQWLYSYF